MGWTRPRKDSRTEWSSGMPIYVTSGASEGRHRGWHAPRYDAPQSALAARSGALTGPPSYDQWGSLHLQSPGHGATE